MKHPFRYFKSSPGIIRRAVMTYVRYPLPPRQVEDLLFERGIDVCRETIRFRWNRFGPVFAAGSGGRANNRGRTRISRFDGDKEPWRGSGI